MVEYGYITGGRDSVGVIGITEQYNTSTNTWTNKAITNTLTPREQLTSFSLNNYGYAVGGFTTVVLGISERYDMNADVWAASTPLPATRRLASAFSLKGYGYLVGGHYGIVAPDIKRFEDIGNTWTTLPSASNMIFPRHRSSAFSGILSDTGDSHGYTAGGTYTDAESAYEYTGHTERYSDVSGIWSQRLNMNQQRALPSAFSLNGMGYTAGGMKQSGTNLWGTFTNITEQFNDLTNTWSIKGNLSNARDSLSAFSANGNGYTTGGYGFLPDGYSSGIRATTEKYSDVSETWSIQTAINTPTTNLAAFTLNDSCPPILCTLTIQ